jgi:6-pyruvoyltetrahydropterin/6-carboxytetrahydropterin synthase
MKLKLNGWDLGISFSACHFLPGHDKCNRLHGHNYTIHLHLTGELDDEGLVYDFVKLKRAMKSVADEMDHCVLMPGKSNSVNVRIEDGQVLVDSLGKSYSFPESDVNILGIDIVSAEKLAQYAMERIIEQLEFDNNIQEIEIGIDEGIGQGAWASRTL